MNIQNIAALSRQLEVLGFGDHSSWLLKQIALRPKNFFLSHQVAKGRDLLHFSIFFEMINEARDYNLLYYDAVFQKEFIFPDRTINGIRVVELEKKMNLINWIEAFDSRDIKKWSVEDAASWDNENKVESVVAALQKLEEDENGCAIANQLKQKFWADVCNREYFSGLGNFKNKTDIGQRFYFFDGEAVISVEDAYRFLLNRWKEKQMQLKKKEAAASEASDDEKTGGSGLLEKKRVKKVNGRKMVQRSA
jgi:hypothetical protein